MCSSVPRCLRGFNSLGFIRVNLRSFAVHHLFGSSNPNPCYPSYPWSEKPFGHLEVENPTRSGETSIKNPSKAMNSGETITMHQLTADKIERDPSLDDLLADAIADKLEVDPGLLSIPLANIDRWIAKGVLSNPSRFLRWRDLIGRAKADRRAFNEILAILRSDSE